MRTVALLITLACSCSSSKSGESGSSKSSPPSAAEPAASADPVLPDSLRVAVEVFGEERPAIVGEVLAGRAADFTGDDFRAWKLAPLLGLSGQRRGLVIAAEGATSVLAELKLGESDADPVPVLIVTDRGEVAGGMIDPGRPLPTFAGAGGLAERAGKPHPLARMLTGLRVRGGGREEADLGDSGGQSDGLPEIILALPVTLDGAPWPRWRQLIAAVEPVSISADDDKRFAWPLRDVVSKAGASARIDRLVVEDGVVEIDRAQWNDAARQPSLRANRRGNRLKYQWLLTDGRIDADSEIRDVRAIELVSK